MDEGTMIWFSFFLNLGKYCSDLLILHIPALILWQKIEVRYCYETDNESSSEIAALLPLARRVIFLKHDASILFWAMSVGKYSHVCYRIISITTQFSNFILSSDSTKARDMKQFRRIYKRKWVLKGGYK